MCWHCARRSKSVWSRACPSVLICWFPKSEVVQEPPTRTGFQQLSTTNNSSQISSHIQWKDYTNGNLPQMADIMIEEGSCVVGMSFLKGLNCLQGSAVTAGFKGNESAIHIRSQFHAWWFLVLRIGYKLALLCFINMYMSYKLHIDIYIYIYTHYITGDHNCVHTF